MNDLIFDMGETVMMTQISTEYFLPNNLYRAVYRMVRDRLVVGAGIRLPSLSILIGNLPASASRDG